MTSKRIRFGFARAVRLAGAAFALCLMGGLARAADRYETAIAMAQDYSFAPMPAKLKGAFGSGAASKDTGFFFDIAANPLYREKFLRLSRALDRNHYLNAENISYLDDIRSAMTQSCHYERFPNPQDPDISVSCGNRYQYYSSPNQYLQTRLGQFIVAKANSYRGNGAASNKNASPAILVVDLADNNIGLATEDKIAASGGRKDVIAAVLTFAASADRVTPKNDGPALPAAIAADLKAARGSKSTIP